MILICILLEIYLSEVSLAQAKWWILTVWSTYTGGILVMWRCNSIRIDTFHKYERQVALVISEQIGGF